MVTVSARSSDGTIYYWCGNSYIPTPTPNGPAWSVVTISNDAYANLLEWAREAGVNIYVEGK